MLAPSAHRTTAMTLEEAIRHLRALLSVPPEQRDSEWAYEVCRATRAVHEPIWQEHPPGPYVEKRVAPLLAEARDAVQVVPRTGKFANEIDGFVANIDWRVRQCHRYAHGEGPEDLPPELVEAALKSGYVRELEQIAPDDD